ncbi:MAG TPA: tetratricopeptide repeat protein [Thermoanaerobaculia bacterium]
MIAALLLVWNLAQLWRDTNSHAANARGVKAFAQKKYGQSVKAFADANSISPSPQRAFNLGTAQVAAGQREAGSATLGKAMADARLREATLFNRGNSALASNAYDSAIRDFTEALKLQPGDGGAKRNLEIALVRRTQQQRQQGGSHQQQKGNAPQPQPQQAQQAPDQQQGDANIEALLRSVQQQEQEELQRMHRPKGERLHVGW